MSHTHMQEARANILRLGGIPRMNTYSKLYLALLGQFPWKYLPAIPVEMVLLPSWSFFNIYKMSSWSRAMGVWQVGVANLQAIAKMQRNYVVPALKECGVEASLE